MDDSVNKTLICSIVFLEIVDYLDKTDSEQTDVKYKFNELVNLSLKTIALNERIVLDTGAGAAIAYVGSAEDALWMTMQIREGFLKYNARTSAPIIVRYGLNVGPIRVVNDINGQPSIAGEGINTAQSIMTVSYTHLDVYKRQTQHGMNIRHSGFPIFFTGFWVFIKRITEVANIVFR